MGRQDQSTNAACQGKQHFSHPHILKLIVNSAESDTLTCNACEQQNIINKPNFYGCNSCQYFLHENCVNAPRFLDHSSHPFHHLTLLPIPTYSSRSYTCNACGSTGNGFSFSCAPCQFDIHMQCASCPSSILVDKHPHHLGIHFGSPYEDKNIEYNCDICTVIMNKDDWLYYCAECDFGSHLHCAILSPEVGVFPRQQGPNPAVETINAVNEAHEKIIAAQLRALTEARGREAALDLF
ncbi:hypothetical protein K7X08_010037 [Anisodus acutangulus]|uniref:DC1 domain-containing protein n=1 Tax=Anisodus acutangulus TaxID=402998 RepID=A0A9Q1N4V4_9SOLA|nr:hypothetical protein K7X08_010037 [Anisodus acutangulus]